MSYVPQGPVLPPSIPPEISQSASAYQLGQQPSAEYHVTDGKRRVVRRIIFVILGVLLIAVGFGIMGQSTIALIGGIVLVIFGGFFIVDVLYMLLHEAIYKSWGVYVFEHGFLFKKGKEAPQPFRWDQIEAVWYQVTRRYYNGVYTGTTHRYRVRRRDGYEVVLTDRFTNVGQLGETISNQVTQILLPQVIAAYNAGQTITFGPLSVNRQGLSNILSNLLPWSEVKGIDIQNGYVAVSRAGKWLKWSNLPVAKIPNVFVFIALVKTLLQK